MFKDELIKTIAKITKGTNTDVEKVLDAFMDTVTKSLKKGEEVRLIGFGTFKTSKRAARMGRNPKTGQTMKIQAKTVAKFVPGSRLKS
jgi:DNA-binding protein HU-beta